MPGRGGRTFQGTIITRKLVEVQAGTPGSFVICAFPFANEDAELESSRELAPSRSPSGAGLELQSRIPDAKQGCFYSFNQHIFLE